MLTIVPESQGNLLAARATGKLTQRDYEDFRGKAEQLMRAQGGRIRVLLEVDDFHGWELGAAWEDLRYGLRSYGQVERCAIVGDRKWEDWLTELSKPFFHVEFFDKARIDDARRWLSEVTRGSVRANRTILNEILSFVRDHPIPTVVLGAALVFFWSRRPGLR